jgi:pSer/pThr/pTyr-binding forkhead associated (FHA) protein
VNRERIDEVPLSSGDEVQIGKFKLVFLAARPS